MTTWHIHIEGQVQGVGFRPYIFLMATQYELNGWVNNTVDGVHVEINATKKAVEAGGTTPLVRVLILETQILKDGAVSMTLQGEFKNP